MINWKHDPNLFLMIDEQNEVGYDCQVITYSKKQIKEKDYYLCEFRACGLKADFIIIKFGNEFNDEGNYFICEDCLKIMQNELDVKEIQIH